MELQHITRYLKRPERLLLGSSGKLAAGLGVPPLVVRIVFAVLTLVFIPFGILLYLGTHWFAGKKRNGKLVLALLGGLLGIPLGYYFQSDMVQAMAGGVSGYLKKFPKIVDTMELYNGNGLEVVWGAFIGVVVLALIGLALGHFIDLSHQRNLINQKSK